MKKQDAVFYQPNTPSQSGTGKRVESSPITFKKSLKGFDTTEVLTYIEEREASYKAACEVYERTIEDYRKEVKQLAAENERLTQDNALLAEKAASFDDRVNEIEQSKQALERRNDEEYTIAQGRIGLLENKIATLEAELEKARQAAPAEEAEPAEAPEATVVPDTAPETNEEAEQLKAEIEEIKAKNDTLRAAAEQLMAENGQLKADNSLLVADNEGLKADNESLKADNEELKLAAAKAQEAPAEPAPAEEPAVQPAEEAETGEETDNCDILSEEIAALNAALTEKDERIKAIEDEFTQYKIDTESALAEAGNAKLQAEKDNEEITSLREINEKQAYEYAGRLNELETAAASEKLRIGKQVQLYSYHIDRISSLLEQANEQFAKAKEAVDELK